MFGRSFSVVFSLWSFCGCFLEPGVREIDVPLMGRQFERLKTPPPTTVARAR